MKLEKKIELSTLKFSKKSYFFLKFQSRFKKIKRN